MVLNRCLHFDLMYSSRHFSLFLATTVTEIIALSRGCELFSYSGDAYKKACIALINDVVILLEISTKYIYFIYLIAHFKPGPIQRYFCEWR